MTKQLAFFMATLTLAGCVSRDVRQGGVPGAVNTAAAIYVAPFYNATGNPAAGRAMTDLTATTLASHGLPLVQSEAAINQGYEMLEAGRDIDFLQIARSVAATHAIVGTVHEYRFKSDLDGAPTVGLTLRLVEVDTGQTVWQGSSSRSSGYYSSLSGTAQGAIDQLVSRMTGSRKTRTITNTAGTRTGGTRQSRWISRKSTPTGRSSAVEEIDYEQIRRRGDTSTSVESIESTTYDYSLPSGNVTTSGSAAYQPAPVGLAPPGFNPPPATVQNSQWTPVR